MGAGFRGSKQIKLGWPGNYCSDSKRPSNTARPSAVSQPALCPSGECVVRADSKRRWCDPWVGITLLPTLPPPPPDADQVSDTLPDTQSESDTQHHPNDSEPGRIWRGHFILSFIPEPSRSTLGWTVGKRRPLALQRPPADILVCTSVFDEVHQLSVRHFHARFTFSQQTGQLGIACSSSNPAWPVTASGTAVGKQLHILTTHTTRFRLAPSSTNFAT